MTDICKCGHDIKSHLYSFGEELGCMDCACSGYQSVRELEQAQRMAAVVSAAVRWQEDKLADRGCDCADCTLIRAVDRYTEMISTPKEK